MKSNILGTDKIATLVVKYSLPAVLSMVIAGMQIIIDGIFLGNFVGQNALASINIVQPFMQVIMGVSMIISVGSLSYLGRSLGEGKISEAQDIFKTALISIIVGAFAITGAGRFFTREIAVLLGASPVLIDGVSEYVRTIALFAPVMALMFLFGFTNRVIGKPELYLKGTVLSLATNILLDYIFVKQLGIGIGGAALATGFSFLTALFVVAAPMLNRKNVINIYKGKFDKPKIESILYNGSSEGVTAIAIATTAYVFNMVFMKIAGESGVAAFTAISYLSQFGTLIMFGISDGITPILSYNYGYRKHDRVSDTLRLASTINLVIGAILFFTLFVFGKQLVSIFAGGNQEILNLAADGSKIYAFAFWMCGFNIINSGYFTAIGNARASILIAASRGIVFIVLGISTLPVMIGMDGVWLTVPFAEFVTLAASVYFVRRSSTLSLEVA